MKIKFLGTNSRAKMAHPCLSIDSLTPPPSPQDKLTEFGAALHQVYIEDGSSKFVVEGSLLTTFLPARI